VVENALQPSEQGNDLLVTELVPGWRVESVRWGETFQFFVPVLDDDELHHRTQRREREQAEGSLGPSVVDTHRNDQ
jgi:hypothetical protein